jgi:hypothetical protein
VLAVEPDLPKRLLAGQEAVNEVKPIKTGIKLIDKMGLLEVTWYTGQLKRIGKGEAPKPKESALWVFAKFAWAQAGLGRKKRAPTKLRAS